MDGVYRIFPDSREATIGKLLEITGVQSDAYESLRDYEVRFIDVDPLDKSWSIHVRTHDSCPQYYIDRLESELASCVPGVGQVRLCFEQTESQPLSAARAIEGQQGSDRSLQSQSAAVAVVDEAPPFQGNGHANGHAPAANESRDEMDEYMEMIARRAKEWATFQEAPEKREKRKAEVKDDVLLGRRIAEEPIPLQDVTDEERSVVIEGEVIAFEVRELRSGRKLITFDVSDKTDSIGAKIFENEDSQGFSLAVGDWVRVRGGAQFDRFSGELTLMPRDIMRVPAPPSRKDDAETPRVELHLHTKMSALDGAVDIDPLIRMAAEWGHPAIAITDHGVVQAFPEAYAAASAAGIKLIYGVEGYLVESPEKSSKMYHIVLLAKDEVGLVNLYKLVSISHLEYFHRRPRIPKEVLSQYREGIWVGSACEAGELYQAILSGAPDEKVREIAEFYDYLEIQPLANNMFLVDDGHVSGPEDLRAINRRIVALGEELGKPVVATGDVHFLKPEDEIFRQIIMAGHGFDVERPTPLYLRTTAEMLEEFSYLGEEKAYEVVVTTPRAIAESTKEMRPVPAGFHPPTLEGADEEIREMATSNAKRMYGENLPDLVRERLDKELASIIDNGYASLYLIAHKLVAKSLEDGYLVGSRGSVGSSFVATMCGITEVNPLPPHYVCTACHYFEVFDDGSYASGRDLPHKACPTCGERLHRDGFDIPFETFLGFHGDKVPDIDLNFSGEYQPHAHKYAEQLFGSDRVFRAGTIGRLAERTAYGYVRNFLDSKGVQARMAEINRLVRGCSGVRRTTGQHPGGLMVVPEGREIYEFTPIQRPANDDSTDIITTHFDCDTIHDTLVKLDILGHDDPTMLRMLEDLTGVNVREIPIDDPETLKIFSGLESLGIDKTAASGEVGTLAIPEFGTRFVRQMLIETRPTTVGELIRISGLSHGTNVWTGNAQELIKNKTSTLKEVIATRDDIMTYLIRQGLSPGEAFAISERIRKGRGVSEEDEQKMLGKGVPKWYIESCRKISYLFPKAHAAAYVMMALRIAYFKVHHPLAFYAAYFSVRAGDFDADLVVQGERVCRSEIERLEAKGNEATAKEKGTVTVLEVALEAMARGVRFHPVDIYVSDVERFLIEGDGLRCPLASIQGVGDAAARSLAEARERPFTSIEDLQRRGKVSKTVIEALRNHGALGSLPETDQIALF